MQKVVIFPKNARKIVVKELKASENSIVIIDTKTKKIIFNGEK